MHGMTAIQKPISWQNILEITIFLWLGQGSIWMVVLEISLWSLSVPGHITLILRWICLFLFSFCSRHLNWICCWERKETGVYFYNTQRQTLLLTLTEEKLNFRENEGLAQGHKAVSSKARIVALVFIEAKSMPFLFYHTVYIIMFMLKTDAHYRKGSHSVESGFCCSCHAQCIAISIWSMLQDKETS